VTSGGSLDASGVWVAALELGAGRRREAASSLLAALANGEGTDGDADAELGDDADEGAADTPD
jgi:hypothetical protein